MHGVSEIHDTHLGPLGEWLRLITSSLSVICFTRVFKELNEEVDKLSKEGQQLVDGS